MSDVAAEIKVGDTAPDFNLKDQDQKDVKLSDYRGKQNVVLCFYPLDWSPVCQGENKCLTDDFPKFQGANAELFGVSCDSFDPDTLREMGRTDGRKDTDHLAQLHRIRAWTRAHGIKFKINTTVTSVNHAEDMNECLIIEGENASGVDVKALRDARDMAVTSEQFESFLERLKACNSR